MRDIELYLDKKIYKIITHNGINTVDIFKDIPKKNKSNLHHIVASEIDKKRKINYSFFNYFKNFTLGQKIKILDKLVSNYRVKLDNEYVNNIKNSSIILKSLKNTRNIVSHSGLTISPERIDDIKKILLKIQKCGYKDLNKITNEFIQNLWSIITIFIIN